MILKICCIGISDRFLAVGHCRALVILRLADDRSVPHSNVAFFCDIILCFLDRPCGAHMGTTIQEVRASLFSSFPRSDQPEPLA